MLRYRNSPGYHVFVLFFSFVTNCCMAGSDSITSCQTVWRGAAKANNQCWHCLQGDSFKKYKQQ